MSDPFAVVGIKPNGDLPDEVRARMAANMADPSKPEGAALSTTFVQFRSHDGTPITNGKRVIITLTADGNDIDDITVEED